MEPTTLQNREDPPDFSAKLPPAGPMQEQNTSSGVQVLQTCDKGCSAATEALAVLEPELDHPDLGLTQGARGSDLHDNVSLMRALAAESMFEVPMRIASGPRP